MSRGHGKVERLILAAVTDELIPVMEIAHDAGYDIHSRSAQQSFKRAADSLYWQDLIGTQWVSIGPYWRQALCVRTPGPDVDDTTRQAAKERCWALYPKQPACTEADFVMSMIRQGRWSVCDTMTGDRVDHRAAWLDSA